MLTTELAPSIRPSADVLCQIVEGQAVLLNLATKRYHSLDEVGTRVWGLLGEGLSTEALVKTMLEEFDVDEATLRSDLATLFAALIEAGLAHPE